MITNNQISISERSFLLDSLKGFAIVLVIVGHAVTIAYPDSFSQNIVFRVIYSFHMPLFFFISGYLTFKYTGDIIFLLVLGLFAFVLPKDIQYLKYFGLEYVYQFYVHFLLGYLLAKYKDRLQPYKKKGQICSLVIFPFLVYFWQWGKEPEFIVTVSNFLYTHSIPPWLASYSFKSLVALAGIGTSFYLIDQLQSRILALLGRYSLGIYALHIYFLSQIVIFSGYLKVAFLSIVATFFSLAICLLITKVELLDFLLLGNYQARQSVAPNSDLIGKIHNY